MVVGSWSDEAFSTGGVGTWMMHVRATFDPVARLAVAVAHLTEAIHRDREVTEWFTIEGAERAEESYRIAIERWQRASRDKRVREHMARFAASRGSRDPQREGDVMLRSVIEDLLAGWLLHDVSNPIGKVRWKLVDELCDANWVSNTLAPRMVEQRIVMSQRLGAAEPALAAIQLTGLAAKISDASLRFAIGDEIDAALDGHASHSSGRSGAVKLYLAAELAAMELAEHFGIRRWLETVKSGLGLAGANDSKADVSSALDLIAWRVGLPPPFKQHRDALSELLIALAEIEAPNRGAVFDRHVHQHPSLAEIDLDMLSAAIEEADGPFPSEVCLALPTRHLSPSGVDEEARDRILGVLQPKRPLRGHRAEVRHWFTSRRDWIFKAGAAAAVVLLVVGLAISRSKDRESDQRAAAYADVAAATQRVGDPDGLHTAAERFLSMVPAGDSDWRLGQVTKVFESSLATEISSALERDDRERLGLLAERARHLEPYIAEKNQ